MIQAVAIFVFVRMGVSTVTTSHIVLGLRRDRVEDVAGKPSGRESEDVHGLARHAAD